MNEGIGKHPAEMGPTRDRMPHRLVNWARERWATAKKEPATYIYIPTLTAANISYALVLAIRPQWPEDVYNFVKNTGIGQ